METIEFIQNFAQVVWELKFPVLIAVLFLVACSWIERA